ncbi:MULTISPECIES: M16 family metallopeptidase [unclassified Campylobacter]|uniref:M16 family metallopeptidase n=1 Tax=unclassified Campylobacter TaxID=2593542 RepID=UPI0022E9C82A|nr:MULTISPECIES: pitrilysin family protein [unclassified Campylobacter]MDA3062416.1 insulinase family protein [Campylobacter sp. JMF_14 EL1]MDA3073465.1 insulinase family protein [Campylobacter sp. JMF_10 EL2]
MFAKFNKITLENGLAVYHIPVNLGSDVISVDLFYDVGSKDEVMGKSGIAHMLEHLNFKSTKNRKAGEFDAIVKGFGGVNNASTGFDFTHYFIKCERSNLATCLDLYADIMENLKLEESEFLPERNVVLEERLWRTDNDPFGYLFFRLYNSAFVYHPYHWTPIGFRSDIEGWKIEDIREFHAKFYNPNNAALLISGDIDEKSAFELAKKSFSHIKNRCEKSHVCAPEPEQDGARFNLIHKDSHVQIVATAFKIPPFNHADAASINALCDYLGGMKSSLLQRILVDEKKLANQIDVYNLASKHENLMIIFGVCNAGISGEKLRDEIFAILENAKNSQISNDEITKLKNSAKSSLIYSMDSASKVASIYGSYIIRGDLDALFRLQSDIENISAQNLNETMKKYLKFKNSTTLILRKENDE